MRTLPLLLILALAACATTAPTPVGDMPNAAACARRLLDGDAIDVSPEPRICADLEAALGLLPPAMRAEVHGLKIVRTSRGPCGDACPDLATALLSDGALAFYRVGRHELHVLDAFFDGPRWRGQPPSAFRITEYLAALGLADWPALVAQLRTRPCIALPAEVPEGAAIVFQEIVRCGAPILLGGDVARRDLLLHELGHAILTRAEAETTRIRGWGSLSGWRGRLDNLPADGHVGDRFSTEQAIVASRLALGLPRGDDSHYVPGATDFATPYAGFDPIEDHAESLRLALTDPETLGRIAPAKLLVLGAGHLDLTHPRLAPFLAPGTRALLAPGVDANLAMDTLRAHAKALAAAPALLDELHNPEPMPDLDGFHPEVGARARLDQLFLVIAGRTLQPHADALNALLWRHDARLRYRDQFGRELPRP